MEVSYVHEGQASSWYNGVIVGDWGQFFVGLSWKQRWKKGAKGRLCLMCNLQWMAQRNSNTASRQNLTQIILSCHHLVKQHIQLPKLPPPPSPLNSLQNENDLMLTRLPKMRKFRLLHSIDLQFSLDRPKEQKLRVKTESIQRQINLSPQNKPAFKRILEKYRRNYHPSNASRGSCNTSDDLPAKTPRKLRELRLSCDYEDMNEIKRMAILNQVICQNNRKKQRLMKDRSRGRQR